jgi:glutamine amidotransferase
LKIAILDYGVGNLYSITCALKRLGAEVKLIEGVKEGLDADALILPGVGNFTAVAEKLSGEKETIYDYIKAGRPLLGICLGLQILLEESEEGEGKGLGIIPGSARRLPNGVKIPHIGWNTLKIVKEHEFVEGVQDGSWVYFVHSYYPSLKEREPVLAETHYGLTFPSIVGRGALIGTQFHPEKSAETGKILLKNFLRVIRR